VFNISTFSDNASSPFWSLLWGHLTRIAEQRSTTKNEHISFHFLYRPPSQPIPEEHLSLLNSPSTDGCLVVGFNTRTDDHRSLLKVPHVVFAGGGDWMVKYDDAVSSRWAAEALARHHCQRVAYWSTTPQDIENSFYQAYFFSRALLEQGFAVDRSLFRSIPELLLPMTRPLTYQERGYLLAKEVYGSSSYEKKPDGLYISDDLMTDGALVAFEELGIRVGEDVHLVSLSNTDSPILFGRNKHMTLLEQNSEDLVRSMFSFLESLMDGERPREDSIYIQPHVREE
jgi:DNA-binding LacI/PurR family transcriptional regulator